jgi:hypothetical protein
VSNPSYTHIQNSRQVCNSVCVLIFIFLKMIAGRQKIVHGIIASVPLLQSYLNFFLNLNTSVFSKEFISVIVL